MSQAALYERQRALVRAGLLHSSGGRGPGSGVRATADAIALLLISLLATDSLSETAKRTKALANLKSVTGRCPLTSKRTFIDAVTAALQDSSFLGITAIRIDPKTEPKPQAQATIMYMPRRAGDPGDSVFGHKGMVTTSNFYVMANLRPSEALTGWLRRQHAR
jgi:hypothetical protein